MKPFCGGNANLNSDNANHNASQDMSGVSKQKPSVKRPLFLEFASTQRVTVEQ